MISSPATPAALAVRGPPGHAYVPDDRDPCMHAEAQIMIRHLLCQNHLGAWAPNGCLRQIEAAAEAAMQRGGSANSRQASGRAGDAGLLAPSGEKKGGGDHGGQPSRRGHLRRQQPPWRSSAATRPPRRGAAARCTARSRDSACPTEGPSPAGTQNPNAERKQQRLHGSVHKHDEVGTTSGKTHQQMKFLCFSGKVIEWRRYRVIFQVYLK